MMDYLDGRRGARKDDYELILLSGTTRDTNINRRQCASHLGSSQNHDVRILVPSIVNQFLSPSRIDMSV